MLLKTSIPSRVFPMLLIRARVVAREGSSILHVTKTMMAHLINSKITLDVPGMLIAAVKEEDVAVEVVTTKANKGISPTIMVDSQTSRS
jgi:hypothetical protein